MTTLASPALVHVGASTSRLPLGERLVAAGVVTEQDLDSALSEQGKKRLRLGEALLEMGFVEEDELLPIIEDQLSIPAVVLREGLIDPTVVRKLPRATAEKLMALPTFCVDGVLTVAMAEPQNLIQVDEIENQTGLQVRPVFALASALERLIARAYENDFGVDAITADLDGKALSLEQDESSIDLQSIDSMAEGSPIINLVNYILVQAVRSGASDIHVEPEMKSSSIRFRIDGHLREILRPRQDFHPAIVSRLKVMSKLDIAEHRQPQDGRMHVRVEGRDIDLRVSTLPGVRGESVVLRVLDRGNITFNLNELGIATHVLKRIKEMLSRPYGLMLVTGPTGSGKTTTLYSALELIKSIERKIITVEDPVEYQLGLIHQVAVGATKQITFASALRSILRQDPDIVMIGEIRDRETAEIAIQAALTGHLVLSTLHTNDSASAVTRLLDMGVESFKIAAALVGVIAQRLLRKICSECNSSYYPPAEVLQQLQYQGDMRRQFSRGEGCQTCFDSGFQGRIGAYEVLTVDREMRQLIAHNPDLERLKQQNIESGGTTLLQEGLSLAEQGTTSIDEVMRLAFSD
jgi:type IV pilus assembly protein PilB